MIHAGNAITVQMLSDGIAEFRFDPAVNQHLSLVQTSLNLVKTLLRAKKQLWIGRCLFTTFSTALKI